MAPDPSTDPHAEAVEQLLAYPGVVGVEVGLKQVAGEPVEQWAYRVLVLRKRALDEVPPDERLPQELNGMVIDVLPGTADPPSLLCGGEALLPGDQLTRWLSGTPPDPGTLCAVVQKGSQLYLATNYHVLKPKYQIKEEEDRRVYVPQRSDCWGIIPCNKPAGRLTEMPAAFDPQTGERLWEPHVGQGTDNAFAYGPAPPPPRTNKYGVDISLVPMTAGRTFTNAHTGLGGALKAKPRDLRDKADAAETGGQAEKVAVKKRGYATGVTSGTIVGYSLILKSDNLPVGTRMLRVHPDDDAPEWTKEFEFIPEGEDETLDKVLDRFKDYPVKVENLGATTQGRYKLRAHGRTFVRHGDSGAPLVDGQQNLVGIIFAAGGMKVSELKDGIKQRPWIYDGTALASYIFPAFDRVGLDPNQAIIPSGQPTSGAQVMVPGSPIAAGDVRLRDLDDEFSGTPLRERLRALAARHLEEVFDLIHERRRVLLVWHRSKGPGFVMEAARAIREPGSRLPTEIDGVTLSESLLAMREVLRAEGGVSLRESLEREGDWLIELAERCARASDLRAELLEATA